MDLDDVSRGEHENRLPVGGASASPTGSEQNDVADAETFLALHMQVQAQLSAFVHTLVPRWQDAEEILQDTALVLWRKFDQFDRSSSFFAWATKIAQYEVLNYRRANQRRNIVLLQDDVLEAVAATAAQRMEDVDIQREVLDRCMRGLSQRHRDIVRRRYMERGGVQAVASFLGRSPGHARRILQQIRMKLLACVHQRLAEIGG